MAFFMLRYYYFLDDDAGSMDSFVGELKNAAFRPGHGSSGLRPFFAQSEDRVVTRLQSGNMVVLVLGIKDAEGGWEGYHQTIQDAEQASAINNDDILANITILGSSAGEWDVLLEEARELCAFQHIIPFSIANGQLARLDWKWPKGRAFYLLRQEDTLPALDRFLGSSLPLLEGTLIRLNMISRLNRERNRLVLKEKLECDQRLSGILHSQLVSTQISEQNVEQLEEQVQSLSLSYGLVAGDYSVITEGSSNMNGLIGDVKGQVKEESFLTTGEEFLEIILRPYNSIMGALHRTEEELRLSRENHQAAIDVVRSRIDLMLSRENFRTQARIKDLMELNTSIQQQSLTFQVAAGIIEFIVLAYYSHSLWKNLAHAAYDLVPPWLQFVVVLLFSFNTVYCTHLIAEFKQGDTHVRKKMLLFSLFLFLLLGLIIGGTYWLELNAAH